MRCGRPLAPGGLPDPGKAGEQRRRRHLGTDTRFDITLFGALVALSLRVHSGAWRRRLLGAAPFGAAMAVLLLPLPVRDQFFRDTVRDTVQAIRLALIIGNVLFLLLAAASDRLL